MLAWFKIPTQLWPACALNLSPNLLTLDPRRHMVLFPLRMVVLVLLNLLFLVAFFGVVGMMKSGPRRKAYELKLVQVGVVGGQAGGW